MSYDYNQMEMKFFVNGPFMVNTYLLIDNGNCVVVDPGHVCENLKQFIIDNNYNLEKIIITHGHIDHVAGVNFLKEYFTETKVLMNKKDEELVNNINNQADLFGLPHINNIIIDEYIPDSGNIELIGNMFEILHVPGHSPGSICLHCEDRLLSGDTLFSGSIGRTDLLDGDYDTLITAIESKLLTLPEETRVFPGHGSSTTISCEKETNPYFNR